MHPNTYLDLRVFKSCLQSVPPCLELRILQGMADSSGTASFSLDFFHEVLELHVVWVDVKKHLSTYEHCRVLVSRSSNAAFRFC